MQCGFLPGVLGLLALVLAACFDPVAPLGQPCSIVARSCPEGQACVNGTCGGGLGLVLDAAAVDATIDADTRDSDGDGVVDSRDNCPTKPNADQADEDKDGVGDACDLCPIDADNTDTDGDGVAGICDPHPTVPGDKIVAWESFHQGIPSTWKVVGNGSIAANGDDAVITDAANQTAALVVPATPVGNGMIMASVTVDATPGTARTALTVGLPFNSGTSRGIECELHAPTPGTTTGREVSLFDSLVPTEPGNNQFVWENAKPYRLAMTRTGTSYTCSATDKDGGVKAAMGNTTSIPAVSEIAVVGFGTSAHIAWVLVVSSP
jgi:hypothetical protein